MSQSTQLNTSDKRQCLQILTFSPYTWYKVLFSTIFSNLSFKRNNRFGLPEPKNVVLREICLGVCVCLCDSVSEHEP